MLKKLLVLSLLLGVAFGLMLLTTGKSHFEVSTRTRLAAAPEVVWSPLALVPTWPRWWPGLEQAVPRGELAVGGVIDLVLKGQQEQAPAVLTRFEPGRALTWERPGLFGSRVGTAFFLVPRAAATELRMVNYIDGPQAFMARITGQEAFTDYQRKLLDSLKVYLDVNLVRPGEKD